MAVTDFRFRSPAPCSKSIFDWLLLLGVQWAGPESRPVHGKTWRMGGSGQGERAGAELPALSSSDQGPAPRLCCRRLRQAAHVLPHSPRPAPLPTFLPASRPTPHITWPPEGCLTAGSSLFPGEPGCLKPTGRWRPVLADQASGAAAPGATLCDLGIAAAPRLNTNLGQTRGWPAGSAGESHVGAGSNPSHSTSCPATTW